MSARQSSLLGSNLRRLRAERGWTLAETAKRTGLSVGTLSKVENGLLSLPFANLSRLAGGFGVPVGTFQALQHRIVDMYISYEQARSMACLAASKVDAPADAKDRARSISAAKIKIADACRHVSQEAVQLHGGMGMSEELKVSHTFRRLTMIAQQFGDADHHLARFSALC